MADENATDEQSEAETVEVRREELERMRAMLEYSSEKLRKSGKWKGPRARVEAVVNRVDKYLDPRDVQWCYECEGMVTFDIDCRGRVCSQCGERKADASDTAKYYTPKDV